MYATVSSVVLSSLIVLTFQLEQLSPEYSGYLGAAGPLLQRGKKVSL